MTAATVDPSFVVEYLLVDGRVAILDRFIARSCVASTRIAIEVLAYFGIQAKATPVRLRVFNPPAAAAIDAGEPLDPETGAWVVEVAGSGRVGKDDDGRGRWDGHLIVTIPQRFGVVVALDMSLDQASRPAKGIELTPTSFYLPEGWPEREFAIRQAGCLVAYQAMDDDGWRTGGDWTQRNRWSPVVGQIVRDIRKRSAAST